jgi:lysophospholipase L1-like esterase
MMHGYDICFISVGINDTYKKMSANYYITSMNCIIRFMLANHIRPVILDIPDYDIVQAYKRQNKSRQLLRKISMQVTGASLDCKQEFRNSLKNLVSEKCLHQATILYYHEWNNKYHQDLQSYYLSDGMHLNTVGYDRLDKYIANLIIQQICMNDSIRVK